MHKMKESICSILFLVGSSHDSALHIANCIHIGFKVVTSYPTEEFLSFRNIGPFFEKVVCA